MAHLNFQWMRNGVAIAGATDSFYRFSAKLEDSGAVFSQRCIQCVWFSEF